MKLRLLAALTVLAALFAIALPAQAAGGHRYRLGHSASTAERASFGCGTDGRAAAFLLHHHGRWTIAPRGTVKHPNRIRAACSSATPMNVGRVLTRLFPADPICELVPVGANGYQLHPDSPNPCDPQGFLPCESIVKDPIFNTMHCVMPAYEDPHA